MEGGRWKDSKSQKKRSFALKHYLLDIQCHRTNELIAAMTVNRRPAQDQANQGPSMDQGGAQYVSPPAEELLVNDDFWGRGE